MRLLALFSLLVFISTLATAQQTVSSKPLWQLEISRNEPARESLGPRVVSGEEQVFYLQAEQVKAVDAATGRQLWTFQVGKWAQLKYTSGGIVAITKQGKIYALEPRTGRVRWSRKGIAANFLAAKQTLYRFRVGDIQAFDLSTGTLLWQTNAQFLQPTSTIYQNKPLTVSENRLFVQSVSSGAITTVTTNVYSAKTGKLLWKAASYGPLAAANNKVYFVEDNFATQLDYPERLVINIYDLEVGKRLEHRTYSVENRVVGTYSSSQVAVDAGAVYISGGGNVACFPLSQQGGRAKPNFIRVPDGAVRWLAGPRSGTFLLEWRGALWLAHQNGQPCTPIDLPAQGLKLGSGKVAHLKFTRDALYLRLKNAAFYRMSLRTGQVTLKLELPPATFGPSLVVGDNLIVQAGNDLLAFSLAERPAP